MKKFLPYILLFFIFNMLITNGFAQKTLEQLQIELKKATDDDTRILVLNAISKKFLDASDPIQAATFVNQALKIAEQANSTEGKALSFYNLGRIYAWQNKLNEAQTAYEKCLEYKTELKDKDGIAKAYNGIALLYKERYDYQKAIENYYKSLELLEELGDQKNIAISYANIAEIYNIQQNYDHALELFNKAIAIYEKLKDKSAIAICVENVGKVYSSQKKYDAALTQFEKSRQIYEELGDNKGLAKSYRNIGKTQRLQNNYQCIFTFVKSIVILQKINDLYGLAYTYSDVGEYYSTVGDYNQSLRYFMQSYEILSKIKDADLEEQVTKGLSDAYAQTGQFKEAYFFQLKHKMMSDTLHNRANEKKITTLALQYQFKQQEKEQESKLQRQKMFTLFFILGFVLMVAFGVVVFRNYKTKQRDNQLLAEQKEALLQQKEEILTTSEQLSFTNKELEKLSVVASKTDNAVVIMDEEGNYQWINEGYTRVFGYTLHQLMNEVGTSIINPKVPANVQAIIQTAIQNKETVIYETQTKARNGNQLWVQTTLTPILDEEHNIKNLIAIDSDITKIKAVEQEIMIQRDTLKMQNQRINSSIRYARTIQKAILPMQDAINEHFDSFILYRPKDIVSGDFYWYSHIKTAKIDKFFFATVDCTGHGVPGAFMSMIGSRMLNEIVNERKVHEPAQVLELLNDGIYNSLQQEQTDNNDGMDLCFCCVEKTDDGKNKVTFSGAERPLIYHKQGEGIGSLKGDHKSIGGMLSKRDTTPFTNQEVILAKGDVIYLTTDGLVDQNDSERNRFGTKRFMQIIEENAQKTIAEQGRILEKELDDFQGHEEQRDDITAFGIRFLS